MGSEDRIVVGGDWALRWDVKEIGHSWPRWIDVALLPHCVVGSRDEGRLGKVGWDVGEGGAPPRFDE
jgi:hypothetical protein